MTTIKYIREKLGEEELLCQLAEEAAELTQAALKLRRCITGKNPTPVTAMQAEAHLVEELADVQLVAEVLDRGKRVQAQLDLISNRKIERWRNRIEEARRCSEEAGAIVVREKTSAERNCTEAICASISERGMALVIPTPIPTESEL